MCWPILSAQFIPRNQQFREKHGRKGSRELSVWVLVLWLGFKIIFNIIHMLNIKIIIIIFKDKNKLKPECLKLRLCHCRIARKKWRSKAFRRQSLPIRFPSIPFSLQKRTFFKFRLFAKGEPPRITQTMPRADWLSPRDSIRSFFFDTLFWPRENVKIIIYIFMYEEIIKNGQFLS